MHNPDGRDGRVRIIAINAIMYGEKWLVSEKYIAFLSLEPEFVVWFSSIKGDFYIVYCFSCLSQTVNLAKPSGIEVEGL